MKTKLTGSFAALIVLLLSAGVVAQDFKKVSGIITAFQNYPLNKVKVLAQKSGETAYSDSAGKFSVNCLKEDVLVIYASGFQRKEIRVKKRDLYSIDLVFIGSETGFERATSGGHISAENLRKAINDSVLAGRHDFSKYNSIYDLISSEVYNVRVKGNTIVNTKMRSFDASPQVLLVVDDRIVQDISFVDPGWVKSIEFIDDVRTSAYGVMGANGVLRILLK